MEKKGERRAGGRGGDEKGSGEYLIACLLDWLLVVSIYSFHWAWFVRAERGEDGIAEINGMKKLKEEDAWNGKKEK